MAGARLAAGARVGVAVGSRGIAGLPEVVGLVVEAVKGAGATPLVIPAMGSHGGATSEGQVAVLHELGVTETVVGAPVEASMDTRQVGTVPGGHPVYLATAALACDAIVPVNRVKPHTDFRAEIESGLTKMLTIGLGKEAGASSLHQAGFSSFGVVLPAAVKVVLSVLNVPFGVALLEDSWHRLHSAEVVPRESLLDRDAALLEKAWELFGALPFAEVDVLVLKEMGKTVSGAGMDPNVTGKFPYEALPCPTRVSRLVVLDLRDDSGGNAVGLGAADVVTERLRQKIHWGHTYANAMASKSLGAARLPLVARTDEKAISVALMSVVGDRTRPMKVAAAINTLEINQLAVTPPLVLAAQAAGYQVVDPTLEARFGPDGHLAGIGSLEFFGTGEVT